MTDETMEIIRETVKTCIAEYKRAGLLRDAENAAYSDASQILSDFYKGGGNDAAIMYAVQVHRFDPYFRALEMYFRDGAKLEDIADVYNVDVSTIVRNKKRLCIAIYAEITG